MIVLNLFTKFSVHHMVDPTLHAILTGAHKRAADLYPVHGSDDPSSRPGRAQQTIAFRSGARQKTDKRLPEIRHQRSFFRNAVDTGGLPAKPPLLQRNQTPYRGSSRTGVDARLRLFLWL